MAKVTLIDEPAPLLLPMQGRSPGIHVSDIIRDLCIRLGHYDKRDSVLQPEWAELGNALEHSIVQRLYLNFPGRYEQPGEITRDGIPGTPDLVDLLDDCVDEVKLAWMSSEHGPGSQKFWRYEIQLMSYCHALEKGEGRLRVYHVNGDYRDSGPEYRLWHFAFKRRELSENWRMMCKHRDRMLIEQAANRKREKRSHLA